MKKLEIMNQNEVSLCKKDFCIRFKGEIAIIATVLIFMLTAAYLQRITA